MTIQTISDDELIEELRRRLQFRNAPVWLPGREPGTDPLPDTNAARQQMTRSLQLNRKRGQPVEILRLLARTDPVPQTMQHIVEHMKRCGYLASRYYDASNALVSAGLAQRTFVGSERAWVITDRGRAFLES